MRVDVDAAWAAELLPFLDELALLIQNLNSIVAAVPYEKTPLGVERERVGLIELDGPCSFLANDNIGVDFLWRGLPMLFSGGECSKRYV